MLGSLKLENCAPESRRDLLQSVFGRAVSYVKGPGWSDNKFRVKRSCLLRLQRKTNMTNQYLEIRIVLSFFLKNSKADLIFSFWLDSTNSCSKWHTILARNQRNCTTAGAGINVLVEISIFVQYFRIKREGRFQNTLFLLHELGSATLCCSLFNWL